MSSSAQSEKSELLRFRKRSWLEFEFYEELNIPLIELLCKVVGVDKTPLAEKCRDYTYPSFEDMNNVTILLHTQVLHHFCAQYNRPEGVLNVICSKLFLENIVA